MVIGKMWRCQGGHVLGLAARGSDKTMRVHVLRQALETEPEELLEVGIIMEEHFVATLSEGVVTCSLCGRKRRWVAEPVKALEVCFE